MAIRDGEPVELTAKEYDLMELLMRNPWPGVQPGESAERGVGLLPTPETTAQWTSTSAVCVKKLEKNPAEPEHIMTKWGVGYYFKG